MNSDVEIGGNPLPLDAQEKLGEFLDWLDCNYDINGGSTALYWSMSHDISFRLAEKKEQTE